MKKKISGKTGKIRKGNKKEHKSQTRIDGVLSVSDGPTVD